LRGYCRRILGSGFETEDAVQETLLRAWRGLETFEGRSSLRTWLYRIATNVCLGMLSASERRAPPTAVAIGGFGDRRAEETRSALAEPVPLLSETSADGDPAGVAVGREWVRLAWVAALGSLPPRQRAVLILREVLHWSAAEVAELLDTSVAAVNSALQRARARLASRRSGGAATANPVDETERERLRGYVDAFERYDIDGLVALLHDDARSGS
jgi:RNA polymerase sigma-70 factor (ECF subfamily)